MAPLLLARLGDLPTGLYLAILGWFVAPIVGLGWLISLIRRRPKEPQEWVFFGCYWLIWLLAPLLLPVVSRIVM